MRVYDYSILKVNKGDTKTHCGHFGCIVQPDLNVNLYDMLVRHQNGQITTLGGMIRHDAQYSSEEDIKSMRVAVENDPKFNLITAQYYIEKQQRDAVMKAQKEIAEKRLAARSSEKNKSVDSSSSVES